MENTVPEFKATATVICERCGFALEDPNQDYEIKPENNARLHRLDKCFELVKAALAEHTYARDDLAAQDAAFRKGFHAKPLSDAEKNAEAGIGTEARSRKK